MAIHRKKIKKMEGSTTKLFEQIALEEEIYELTRQKEQKKRDETMEFINRFRAQAARASLVQSRIKSLEKMGVKKEMGKIMELGFSFKALDFKAQTIMRAHSISFGYTSDKTLISDFSIDIGNQDRICVIGKNGKGKTTLLRLLAGELKPDQGEITRHPNYQQGYFGQTNIERLNPKNTIEKELSDVRPDITYGEVRGTCGAMMFSGDLALKKISVLSGGEKSRVSLGKILLKPTNILLLDEPTNHLDIESCDSMIAALDDFPNAVVIVTHSEMFLHHLATRLIVFNEDRVFVFEGTYQEYLDKLGWEDEPKKQKKEKKFGIPAENNDLKGNKKRRKELLSQIAIVEKTIDDEEAAYKTINQKMANSFGALTSSEIKNFQIKSHEHQMIIDAGYKKLEELIEELDRQELKD
jgi:ATP-binding cassette subfamily F protein 3